MEDQSFHHADALRPKRSQRFLRFKLQPGDTALLDRLSQRQRDLLLAEGTYKERAERLGLPLGTVRSGLHRARVALEALREEQPLALQIEAVNPLH